MQSQTPTQSPNPIRAVIFDIDGTLVDSNEAHALAWHEALERSGLSIPIEAIRTKIGMGGDKLLPSLTGIDPESPQGKAIRESRKAIFKQQYVSQLKPFPQASKLLQTLHELGAKIAVATSGSKEDMDSILEIPGLEEGAKFLDVKINGDDADSSKPDPDVVESALQRLGIPADQAIFVGDTPYDGEAARRAGVPWIALRSGGWSDSLLQNSAAVFENVQELLEKGSEVLMDRIPSAERKIA